MSHDDARPGDERVEPFALTDEVRRDVVAHLTRWPALRRVLDVAASRYRSYNGLRGEIRLESFDEVEAVAAVGAALHGRNRDRVYVAELDRAFRFETRFATPLPVVLELATGQPVITRTERMARAAAALAAHDVRLRAAAEQGAALYGALPEVGRAALDAWFAADGDYVRSLAPDPRNAGDDDAPRSRSAEVVARALGAIWAFRGPQAMPVSVPVLAERAAGDPHALDVSTAAGRLLDRALALAVPELGVAYPLMSAEARELLYAGVNLAVDELSSDVSVYHLLGDAPLLVGARAQDCVVTLPLATVTSLGAVGAAGGVAYVVENPAVFMGLVRAARSRPNAAPEGRPTLVCTAGQLSVAARRLLDALAQGRARLCYGGDFDVMGLTIAQGVCRRWPGMVSLWRMDPEDFDAALPAERRVPAAATSGGAEASGGIPRDRLSGIAGAFPELADRLAAFGPVYQEALLERLAADLCGGTPDALCCP